MCKHDQGTFKALGELFVKRVYVLSEFTDHVELIIWISILYEQENELTSS